MNKHLNQIEEAEVEYIERGSIIQYFPLAHGSKQGNKLYYAVVVSNDKNNRHSRILNVLPISSSPKRLSHKLPCHVLIPLIYDSVIMCEQIETISIDDVFRVTDWVLTKQELRAVNRAMAIQLGIYR